MKHYRGALLAKQMSWGALTLQKHARGWLARQKKKKTKGEIPVGEVAPIYRQEPRENDTPIKNQNKINLTIVAENKKTYIQVLTRNTDVTTSFLFIGFNTDEIILGFIFLAKRC